MVKVNFRLLPIKAHYFFFLAGMGPVLPFLPVFGKHLGVSEVIVGGINGTIPLLFLGLKPFFGYLIDYFQKRRKLIFMLLIFFMGLFFFLMSFIPDGRRVVSETILYDDIKQCGTDLQDFLPAELKCGEIREAVLKKDLIFCSLNDRRNSSGMTDCNVFFAELLPGFYSGFSFWAFVILMSLGTIGYNLTNSISDAICFDMLGEGNQMLYGKQRVWGTIGFGVAALVGGYFMSVVHDGGLYTVKDFMPAIYLCVLCIIVDLACCQKLKLPPLPKSESIIRDIHKLVVQPRIAVFLLFAVFVGMCDSSIIFYLLWYLEDLAKESANPVNMKLLQGLTVAAETLVGEVVSFYLSGAILSKIGYGPCLSLCFAFYTIRLGLIAIIPSPWWILPIEVIMQGPTYALCYTVIVAYASAISPPGTSATVQGIVAGMDDGFGFSIGSMIGSVIYKYYGGRVMFACAAGLAFTSCITHTLLYTLFFKKSLQHEGETHRKPKEQYAVENTEKEATLPLK